MQRGLRDRFAGHPLVGEVRGVGLLGAIELVADKAERRSFEIGARLAKLAEKHGVTARALADTLAFSPPLIITENEIEEMLNGVARARRADGGVAAGEAGGGRLICVLHELLQQFRVLVQEPKQIDDGCQRGGFSAFVPGKCIVATACQARRGGLT